MVLQAKVRGKWRKIGAARADSAGIFTGLLRTGYGFGRKGAVRVRYATSTSPAFPMNPVGDFIQEPFGNPS